VSELLDHRIARVLGDLRRDATFYGIESRKTSLAERMSECATPGASIAVIDDFQVAWARGFGIRKMADTAAVTAATPFQAASISKAVFALAVMRLVEDGSLDLDADIDRYLRSWRVPEREGWRPRLTLRQLLSHTAGTTVHGFIGYPATGPWPRVPEILNGVRPANNLPVFVDTLPGFRQRYSGGGTMIAQQVVMDRLDAPFPDIMRRLVLGPLEMTSSTFEQPLPAHLALHAAHGHTWNGVPIRGGSHVYPETAAAGLWTTAEDLARLGVAVLRSLRGDASPLGISQAAMAAMLQPPLPDQQIGQDFHGLGWSCTGKDALFRFGHPGWNEGFIAALTLLPAQGKGAVVMLNSNQGWPVRDEIIAAIGREYAWPESVDRKSEPVMPTGLDCAGSYRSASGVTARVAQTDDALILELGEQPPIPLRPADAGFAASVINLQVQFEVASDGIASAMTLHHGGNVIKLDRSR